MTVIHNNSFNIGAVDSEYESAKKLSGKLINRRVPHCIIPEDSIVYNGKHGHIKGCFDFVIVFIYKGRMKSCGVQVVRAMTHPAHYSNNDSYNINIEKLGAKINEIRNGKKLFKSLNYSNIFEYGTSSIDLRQINSIDYTMVMVVKQGVSCINDISYPNTNSEIIDRMIKDMNKYDRYIRNISKVNRGGITTFVKHITNNDYDGCFKSHKKK